MRFSVVIAVLLCGCGVALPRQAEKLQPIGTAVRVHPVDAVVREPESGGPWDDDGTAPDVRVEFNCHGTWDWSDVRESSSPQWDSTDVCSVDEAAIDGGLKWRAVDVDPEARDVLMDTGHVNVGESDITRGTLPVWTAGHPMTVFLTLAADGDLVTVTTTRFEIAPPLDRPAWDRDGSGPDVLLHVDCGHEGTIQAGPVEASEHDFIILSVPFDGGVDVTPLPACTVSREALYRHGLEFLAVDDDGTELLGEGTVPATGEGDTVVEVGPTGSLESLRMSVTREPVYPVYW